MADRAGGPKATASRAASSIFVGTGAPEIKQASKARDVLTINHGKCYRMRFLPSILRIRHRLHDVHAAASLPNPSRETCAWCGGPGRAPCEVYCPVPGAIVPAKYDPVSSVVSSARTGLSMPVQSVLLPVD